MPINNNNRNSIYHCSRKDRISQLFHLVVGPNIYTKFYRQSDFVVFLYLNSSIGFHNKVLQHAKPIITVIIDYFVVVEMCSCYFIFIVANNYFIFHLLCSLGWLP